MKLRAHTLQCLLAASLALAVAGLSPLPAAPPGPPAKPEIQPAVSVFAYPDNPSEGRDPFFPGSSRVFENNPDKQSQGPSLTDLTLKSILGAPPRLFAIINNHTFAVGDDGDVILKDGQRLHIRCKDINSKNGTVTVEAGGTSQTLHLSP
jgi:hypothetical protein